MGTNNKNSTRYYSNIQEKRVAKNLNGKRVANSGATPYKAGDVFLNDFLVECKTVVSPCKQVSIKKEWLTKGTEEAFSMGKSSSLLVFDFGDGQDFVALRLEDFKKILFRLGELK